MTSNASQLAASRAVEPATGSVTHTMPLTTTPPRALAPDGTAASAAGAPEMHNIEAPCEPVVTDVGACAQRVEPIYMGEIACDAYDPEPPAFVDSSESERDVDDDLGHAPQPPGGAQ